MITAKHRTEAAVAGILMTLCSAVFAQARLDDLDWAYAISPPSAAEPDDGSLHSLPGTDLRFTRSQINTAYGPADWFPGDHPPMPSIVADGRQPAGIMACALCHLPNGQGKAENAPVAGLDAGYIVQQLHDMRAGLRHSANTEKANTNLMVAFATNMTDEEIDAAAQYFSSMQWRPWIEVVETDTVPKMERRGGLHIPLEGAEAGTEPLGHRIIETPVDPDGTELLRNPRSGFIAYVPKGAVAAGETLATTGGGKSLECAICHGENLAGLGQVPPLRGRSPSYLARQLYDFQAGTRRGTWSPLMQRVVERLSGDDIINLTAYLASLPVE
jgi:cytochrome c553